MSGQDNCDWKSEHLKECREQFIRTGNGVWAWEGIAVCCGKYMLHFRDQEPPIPFPEWITEYLGTAAHSIAQIGDFRNPENLESWEALDVGETNNLAMLALKLRGRDRNGEISKKNFFAKFKKQRVSLLRAIWASNGKPTGLGEFLGQLGPDQTKKQIAEGRNIQPQLRNSTARTEADWER